MSNSKNNVAGVLVESIDNIPKNNHLNSSSVSLGQLLFKKIKYTNTFNDDKKIEGFTFYADSSVFRGDIQITVFNSNLTQRQIDALNDAYYNQIIYLIDPKFSLIYNEKHRCNTIYISCSQLVVLKK